ncbi:MAG: hypothetical protein J6D21_08495 [Clostridia bacterium]|nr:hypothetical protein [Clostridia bacterium]
MKKLLSFLLLGATLLMLLTGCGYASTREESEPVFSLMGYDVPYEVYRFYAMSAKASYGLLDEDGNTRTDDAGLLANAEKAAMESIYNLYAALSVGEKLGFHIDDKNVVYEAESYFNSLKDSYESESAFRTDMKAAYMNKSVVMLVYGASYIENEAYQRARENGTILQDEASVRAFFESDELIRVKHILIQPSIFTNAKEMADIAYKKALAAENFDTVYKLYRDSGIYTEDRYMARGETYESFEDAAFALTVGQLAPLTETAAGYSVFVRYEKDPAAFEKDKKTFTEQYSLYQFNRLLEDAKTHADLQYYDAYDQHPFAEIK